MNIFKAFARLLGKAAKPVVKGIAYPESAAKDAPTPPPKEDADGR